jgi:cytochrome c-type biogenesis protein CcmF
MIAEIGHFALVLAFCAALVQGVIPLMGAQTGRADWIAMARSSSQTTFFLVLISYLALTWCFYVDDFSVAYVANHSNSLLPVMYKISGVWGGHEGSLLLWVFMMVSWTYAVAQFSKGLDAAMVARVISVLGLVTVAFLAFVLLTSNPFDRMFPVPADGRDLNPLLQDPGLVYHPPLLYMGYVGLSVAFAFAIASLISGRLDAAWARWSRPWTVVAWAFLTLGIALGSWWAYYELGWGGWWFWDPVENASFIPWLIATALIHSLVVTEKRGGFKAWTVLLAIAGFSMSLLGTFLVRSGVLTSVHAFATDPTRGLFILLILAITVGASLTLFAWRASQIRAVGQFETASRESLMLIGNVFLVVAAGSVLLGTLYPLLLDALNLGKISVGPPYFNAVFVPLMVPVALLMALTPLTRWKRTELKDALMQIRWVGLAAGAAAVAIPLYMGAWTPLIALGLFLSVWVGGSTILQVVQRMKSGNPPISYWGMQVAHFGIAVFMVGVTMVGGYEEEKDVRMEPNEVVRVGNYDLTFKGVTEVQGPNYIAQRGVFEMRKEGKLLREMYPEKRNYFSSTMPMTEADIDIGFTRDIYVSLGEPLEGAAWAVRVYNKPFVDWVWGGCLFMALGGFMAIADRRYRIAKIRQHAAALAGKAAS